MNKYLTVGAIASASIAAVAAPATAAVTVSGSVDSMVLNDSDPGLVLYGSALSFADFVLANVGDTHTVDVMTIGTQEGSVNIGEDTVAKPISANFTFSSPAGAAGTANGQSYGFIQLFTSCGLLAGGCGRVSWSNPTIFNFGNGGSFSMTLSQTTFETPGSANVSARFELLANSVPEPSTWAMLILGFGIVGAAMRSARRQRTSVSFA
ncbi:PEPxxWA-CTERM sorting domain-containing protein [Qipengyuania sp.]|uniref:PEPxxWA-CTERM sorting domain-containing protein n=1 Tax=Qipengyuania sp. TaxID=2004515 RepID=UPI0035C7DCAF